MFGPRVHIKKEKGISCTILQPRTWHYLYIALNLFGRQTDLGADTKSDISECSSTATRADSQKWTR